MGKQINFFMLDQDLAEIDAKVKELGLTIIADRMPTEQIIVLDSLINDFYKMFLLRNEDLKEITFEYLEEHNCFWIHPMLNPVLECNKSLELKEKKLITLGRFFYDSQFRNHQKKFVTKNVELTNNVTKLFKWFHTKFKQKIDGYFIGNYTYEYALQNNYLLRTNNTILTLK